MTRVTIGYSGPAEAGCVFGDLRNDGLPSGVEARLLCFGWLEAAKWGGASTSHLATTTRAGRSSLPFQR